MNTPARNGCLRVSMRPAVVVIKRTLHVLREISEPESRVWVTKLTPRGDSL